MTAPEDVSGPHITAVPVELAARVLIRAGAGSDAEERLKADLQAGAPQNPDGTLNLLHYAAWLLKGGASGDRP